MNLSDVELIPLPLEPQVKIRGIIPETATLFKVTVVDLQTLPLKKDTFYLSVCFVLRSFCIISRHFYVECIKYFYISGFF